ncbi:MAG: thrombospondin type-1 domain-containing protein, partial [Myxococcota bacterium]
SCGPTQGMQTRGVRCEDADGQEVDRELCENKAEEPIAARDCQSSNACIWATGAWSACSETCGEGLETRMVTCTDPSGNTVPNARCDALDEPAASQSCTNVCDWVTSAWGNCSVQCANQTGTEMRTVECRDPMDMSIPDAECPQPKPPVSRSCSGTQPDGSWDVGVFGPCEGPLCIRSRTVSCPAGCCPRPEPARFEECNPTVCCNNPPCPIQ